MSSVEIDLTIAPLKAETDNDLMMLLFLSTTFKSSTQVDAAWAWPRRGTGQSAKRKASEN